MPDETPGGIVVVVDVAVLVVVDVPPALFFCVVGVVAASLEALWSAFD